MAVVRDADSPLSGDLKPPRNGKRGLAEVLISKVERRLRPTMTLRLITTERWESANCHESEFRAGIARANYGRESGLSLSLSLSLSAAM